MPDPYIPQHLFTASDGGADFRVDGTAETVARLSRRARIVARSGIGKSVLVRFLPRAATDRFITGDDKPPLPVLIDLRSHPLAADDDGDGRALTSVIPATLRSEQVGLPDGVLDYLIGKGGFLLLIDAVNEISEATVRGAVHGFLNADAAKRLILGSQFDMLQRKDLSLFSLAEVSEDQAANLLRARLGSDVWPELPAGGRRVVAQSAEPVDAGRDHRRAGTGERADRARRGVPRDAGARHRDQGLGGVR